MNCNLRKMYIIIERNQGSILVVIKFLRTPVLKSEKREKERLLKVMQSEKRHICGRVKTVMNGCKQ